MSRPSNRAVSAAEALLSLTKLRITVMVTLSSATGYFWAAPKISIDLLNTLAGVLLLACGSAALNHVQDAKLDGIMKRTRGRPIPSGKISRANAFFIGGLLVMLGLYFLASIKRQPVTALGLGLAAICWYNGVYYYLKRVTAFAVVPGSLIGAIPPVIGWVGGGGQLLHPFAILLGAFFFVWQIPHFWLLMINRAQEYKDAGLPELTSKFQPAQLGRITSIWLFATAAGGLIFPALAGDQVGVPWRMAMFLASIWLFMAAAKLLKPTPRIKRPFHRAFMEINGYAVVMMLCLSLSTF